MACRFRRRSVPAHRPTAPRKTLTPITTVSSPWNLGIYLSPLVTSELLRGLKRHITLMVHSAGSAIFHGLRMEIHRPNTNIVYPGSQERPSRGKREAEPLVFDLRFRKDGLSIFSCAKRIYVFLLVTSPCCYEAMIPVDPRLATSPLLLLWMWFTMTSSQRHSLCCCNGTLNYLRTATKEAEESLAVHTPNDFNMPKNKM